MKEHNYKKIIGKNDFMQNMLALSWLIEYGRANFLNDKFYDGMLKNAEEKTSSFMTAHFQKEIVKIARDMAKMSPNDLYDFIKQEVRILNKNVKER